MKIQLISTTILAASLAFASLANAATVTVGWEAADWDGSSSLWAPTEFDATVNSGNGGNMRWRSDSNNTKGTGSTNFTNISAWTSGTWGLSDQLSANKAFADMLGTGVTNDDATWELVFRPGDFTGAHNIMKDGGDKKGTRLALDGSILWFTSGGDGNLPAVSYDLSGIGGTASDFYHVVATLSNVGSTGTTATLYVNGVLRGSTVASGTATGWGGTGSRGAIGRTEGSVPPITFTETFADPWGGDMSILRLYGNDVLDSTEVTSLYNAVIPEPSSAALVGSLGLLALLRRRR